jgi:hypothetical protein
VYQHVAVYVHGRGLPACLFSKYFFEVNDSLVNCYIQVILLNVTPCLQLLIPYHP